MDHHLVIIYLFYRSPLGKTMRVLAFLVLSLLVITELLRAASPAIPLFLLNIQIMLEIFYRYHLSSMQGKQVITGDQKQDPLLVMTLPAHAALQNSLTTAVTVKRLLTYPQVRFFLERTGIVPTELPLSELGNAVLPPKALVLARQVGGKRVTTVDLFAAYLFLEEEQSKLLFSKKLKEEDVVQILHWTRLLFPFEEEVRKFRLTVNGGGLGETLVSGWTLETQKYTREFGSTEKEKEITIVGRENEYKALKESLLKLENNNVILIGEIGVGKEQLIRKLSLDSYGGKVESGLEYKRILELMVGSLLAGASAQGELQQRLQAIIEEISHAHNVILYIPEFQNLLGAGSFSLDLSGALVPYLKTGKLPIITSVTDGNYKAFVEKSAVTGFFTPIHLVEPDLKHSERMVMEKTRELEHQQSAIITYQALCQAVKFADRYSQNTLLPGSAIDLLSDALSRLQGKEYFGESKKRLLTGDDILSTVEAKTKIALHNPSKEEKTLLLNLEGTLHQSVIGQQKAITGIAEALRRLRSGLVEQTRPVSFLFLGPTGVGKTETAKALARVYFGGDQAMIRLDMSEYADEVGLRRLLGSLPGEGEGRGELTDKVRDHPYSLILLDEFEKAHPAILNLFLQILEDGRLTDNRGQTVSFVNTIIIATSNAGSEFIHQAVSEGTVDGAEFEKQLLTYIQEKGMFKPELLNRFDATVAFKPLTKEEIMQVTSLLLQDVTERLREQDIAVTFSSQVLEKIVGEGYDKEFGARPIRRYLQDTIEDLIAKQLLNDGLHRGDAVVVGIDEQGNFSLNSDHLVS